MAETYSPGAFQAITHSPIPSGVQGASQIAFQVGNLRHTAYI
jgi:hypothetical protein